MIPESLEVFVPFKKSLIRNLRYAGYERYEEKRMLSRVGIVLPVSFVLALFLFKEIYILLGRNPVATLLAELAIVVVPQFIIRLLVSFKADKRGQLVDRILPDALQLISANIRAGMTVDRAIWLSARPEFGPLAEEIKRVSKEVLGSAPLPKALGNMTERIKSKSLDRAIRLIVEGLKGGGEMAKLLDQVSTDIRNFQSIVEEVRAATVTYTMFIILAAVIGAPLLFGISTFFIEVMHNIFASRVMPEAVGAVGTLRVTGPQVSPDTVRNFSLAALLTITFFASLIIGLIRTGEARNGFKYFPLVVGGSLAVFFLAKSIVAGIFGSILVL